ncbi:uncharacterized protein LOC133382123 isoform X2 [Rhineura floridana]|nr:uncharacterized protein LOC133382123 isoform X2 [Rhineura floridana]
MGTIRALVARVEALEKERRQPLDVEAGSSSAPAGKKSARLAARVPKSSILADLVSRIGVLEAAAPFEEPVVAAPPAGLPVVTASISSPVGPVLPAVGSLQAQLPSQPPATMAMPAGASGLVAPPVVASPAAYAGVLSLPVPVRIVLCGHSILFWAHRRASSSIPGTQLQLSAVAIIRWEACRGMLWDALLLSVCRIMSSADRPHVLLIHLGGNDLVQRPGMDLLLKIICDLTWLSRSFPNLLLVWSDMLVRRVWRGAFHPNRIDRSRKWVNRKVRALVLSLGGAYIPHDRIRFHTPQLFRDDGVHLSEQGCGGFFRGFDVGIKGFVNFFGLSGPSFS